MKERPILFSAPMVRTILEGRKTQTRRVVKDTGFYAIEDHHGAEMAMRERAALATRCPYGQPGNRLWVREAFQPLFADGVENHWETDWKTGKGYAISYPATDGIHEYLDADDNLSDACKPSIHMPRWASRITLEIASVRVERLNDISEADCIAEGCAGGHGAIPGYAYAATPFEHYRALWESINGTGSWDMNPWVFVIEFRMVQP